MGFCRYIGRDFRSIFDKLIGSMAYWLEVPPPTRGWSRRLTIRIDSVLGSPAHAGMVPWAGDSRRVRSGFPRPRGDGPYGFRIEKSDAPVPPPTRGWSRVRQVKMVHHIGSPAHAGMVPLGVLKMNNFIGFPRPRGDGPVGLRFKSIPFWVPPPTRGWSRIGANLPVRRAGSPAHAGMVPVDDCFAAVVNGFPRPRGDGPNLPSPPLATR